MKVKLEFEVPKEEVEFFERVKKFFFQAREEKSWEIIRSKILEDWEFKTWKG